MARHLQWILDVGSTITLRHTTVGRTPLDQWSARRRFLYLNTQHSQGTDIHATGRIGTRHSSKRAAAAGTGIGTI